MSTIPRSDAAHALVKASLILKVPMTSLSLPDDLAGDDAELPGHGVEKGGGPEDP
jgi:hypothetical protein